MADEVNFGGYYERERRPPPLAQRQPHRPWDDQEARLAQRRRAQGLVWPPAVFMLVVGILSLLGNVFMAVVGVTQEFGEAQSPDPVGVVLIVLFAGAALLSFLGALGTVAMFQMRHYWLAILASVAIMLGGLSACLLGLAAGVWGLVVLLQPGVRQAFDCRPAEAS